MLKGPVSGPAAAGEEGGSSPELGTKLEPARARPLLHGLAGGALGAAAGAASLDAGVVAACSALGALAALCLSYRQRAVVAERRALDAAQGVERFIDEARARVEAIERLHADAEAARQGLVAEVARRSEAESALVEAQKLEAVGRLSGVIAHDFNNLLTIIMSYADLAKGRLKRPDEVAESLDAILLASARAADLTRRLLTFARRQVVAPRVLTLEAHLESLAGMLARLVGEDVKLELSLARPESNVLIDPSQLEQLLLNLAANARDAMPRGGILRLETRRLSAVEGAGPGEVELAVIDTGSGMDAATKARMFEAFFTTKASGKGTGLGLASAQSIVGQAGGRIGVESEPDRGSVFRIVLPRVMEKPSEVPLFASAPVRGGTETILIVEDDDALLAVTCEALAAAGYDVLAAPSMAAALLLASSTQDDIELLVTDVVMRGGDGYELSERLRAERPDLAVLFVSGYPNDVIERHGLRGREIRLLRKPFTARELEREVRDVLDIARKQSGHRVTRPVSSSSTGSV